MSAGFTHADNVGWSIHIDNDLFLGGDRDQDYTGGLSVTLSGERAQNYHWSGVDVRRFMDKYLGFNALTAGEVGFSVHAAEAGFVLFTPADITIEQPQFGECPTVVCFSLEAPRKPLFLRSSSPINQHF